MGRPGPTVAIKTLGCRVNQADSDQVLRSLTERGFLPVPFGEPADVVVVNTCTVTHVADRKSRQMVARGVRSSPGSVLVITGCYASVERDLLGVLFPGALVYPPFEGSSMIDAICEAAGLPKTLNLERPQWSFGEQLRVRAMVKVQEGCDHVCAFCIIPRARGKSTSRPTSEVLDEVRRLVAGGAPEVVLTGVSLGSYRCPETGDRLGALATRVAGKAGAVRVRLSSVEPMDFDWQILDVIADGTICPHLHLPLQSGCAATLARMRRKYTPDQYRQIVHQARQADPDVAIATDLLVGFPGETEAEFEESMRFVEEMAFAYVHVFPYSARKRTLAARMPGAVAEAEKNVRVQAMIDLGERLQSGYARRFVGQRRSVIWESVADGVAMGVTDNFLRVVGRSERLRTGALEEVYLHPGVDGALLSVAEAVAIA